MSTADRTAPMGLRLWIRRFQTEAGRQTSVLYGAQLASSVLNFVFLTALARTLSPDQYGVFSFCLVSLVTLLVAGLGLGALFAVVVAACAPLVDLVFAEPGSTTRVAPILLAAAPFT